MTDKSPLLQAIYWMAGAIFSFSMMAIAVRELSGRFDPFQILFFRSLVGVVILGVVLMRTNPALFRTRRPLDHLLRHSIHFFAQVLWVVGIALLPLAQVFAVEFTSPIWGSIFAVLLLRERMSTGRIAAIIGGFIGILIILRPGMLPIDQGVLAVLGAALGFGLVNVLTKRLTSFDPVLTIVFWMCAVQALMGLPFSLWNWVQPAWSDVPWLLGIGVCGLSAHYCLSKALSLADAVIVLPMEFLRLPLIAIVAFFAYQEAIDPWTMIGGAVIFAGIYFNLRRETSAAKS